ncbi:MAG: hypothetical protein JKY08_07990 [Flavobacteriaceae bacterium]|nr:hypothetical protein [Flavobacteriaceae bacterium]
MAEFYSARSNKILPPLWTSFALPFTMLYDKEKQDIKLSGIYYNYPMVDIGSSQQLFKLDKFLKDLFTGNQTKLSIQLKASLSKSQRAKILGYRFSNGFKYKIKYKYSIKQIYQIVRCWKHE